MLFNVSDFLSLCNELFNLPDILNGVYRVSANFLEIKISQMVIWKCNLHLYCFHKWLLLSCILCTPEST